MFVREYGFTITEHDPDRPWMVLSSEHHTIKLPDGMNFFAWAAVSGRRRAGAFSSIRGSSRRSGRLRPVLPGRVTRLGRSSDRYTNV